MVVYHSLVDAGQVNTLRVVGSNPDAGQFLPLFFFVSSVLLTYYIRALITTSSN
jgi:hypothetical protein